MKKYVSIFLTALLIFSLSACGAEISTPEDDYSSETETTSNVVRVTFPEGYTALQIAEKLEENGVCSKEEFLTEVNNTEYLDLFGIEIADPENRYYLLEGYLFPDTYDFYLGESPVSVIKKFLRNFDSKITDDIKAECKEMGYTLDEILTLASVIQRECGNGKDDAMVSSVIHNRLKDSPNARLECDSTTYYLRENVKPYVTENEYMFYVELYSTYDTGGIPEGPINNCGLGTINAALNPEESSYYYFVTDNNGNFYFSETLSEHYSNCTVAGIY